MALQTRSDMELWDRPFQTQLIAVLLVNVLAHALNIPVWVTVVSVGALLWKIGHLYLGWPLPKKMFLYGFGALVGSLIIFEYKTLLGHEAATPVLVFLASLKLLETNRDRDARFIIVTSYFLLMAHLLHSQSLGSTFFMAFDVALITILMFQLHRADRKLTSISLRPVVRLLIFTIPVWLCLFVVFPRFSMKLFRASQPAQATGFNEGLDPGSVSSLAQSDEVAFRVQFLEGPRRSPESLYWRGAALYEQNELTWTPMAEMEIRSEGQSLGDFANSRLSEITNATSLSYEVVMEPGPGRALFTLPTVTGFQPGRGVEPFKPYVTSADLLRLGVRKFDRIAYRATAVKEDMGPAQRLSAYHSERALAENKTSSARYDRLIEKMKRSSKTAHEAMVVIDDYFSKNDFRYTLSPGDAKSLTVDDFLFRTKKGFCEHFAAASATILRSLGFPARVVVGYQGGKWNDVSKALIVRSRDAHAWVEVWHPLKTQPGKGRWVTYDPTASIAPLRLRLGGDFLDLPEEEQRGRDVENERTFNRLSQNLILRTIDRSMMIWDYAQMSWTKVLLNYDRSGQREFINQVLAFIGLGKSPWVILGLLALSFGIGLRVIFLWQIRRPNESKVRREWSHLEKEFQRLGLIVKASDGPLTVRDRVASPVVQEGIDAFIALQYGPPNPDNEELYFQKLRRARREIRKNLRKPSLKVEPTPLSPT